MWLILCFGLLFNIWKHEVVRIGLSLLPPDKIKYLPKRAGERYASALTKMNLNNQIIRLSAKIRLKDYVSNFLINNH